MAEEKIKQKEKEFTEEQIKTAARKKRLAEAELRILEEQLGNKAEITAEDKEDLQYLQDKVETQKEILALDEAQQAGKNKAFSLQKQSESIEKKLTKQMLKQRYSAKDTVGFGKLRNNYGLKWLQQQRDGQQVMTVFLKDQKNLIENLQEGTAEEALYGSKEAQQEAAAGIQDIQNDMESISAGYVDQAGYAQLISKYKSMEKDNKLPEVEREMATLAKKRAQDGEKFLKKQKIATGLAEKMKSSWKKIAGFVGVAAIGLGAWKGLKSIFTAFSGIVDKVGATFGAIGGDVEGELQTELRAANIEAIGFGKGLEDVIGITTGLSDEFGVGLTEAANMSNEILNSSVAMGLSVDEGAKLFGMLMKIGGESHVTAEELAEGAYNLAEASHVNPAAVMRDIANNAEVYAKFARAGSDNITEAAVHAKQLGLSLSDVGGIAENLLDFESSLNAELEASQILGRRIYMGEARRLALMGDLPGMMDEVVKQTKAVQHWTQLDFYDRRAIAKLAGTDLQTLAKMVAEKTRIANLTKEQLAEERKAEDTISGFTDIMGKLKMLGMTLVEGIGPELEGVLGLFSDWLTAKKGAADSPFGTLRKDVKAYADRIGDVIGALKSFFTVNEETKKSGIDEVFERAKIVVDSVTERIDKLINILGGIPIILALITTAWIGLKIAMIGFAATNPFGWITLAITGIIMGIMLLWKNWDKVSAFFDKTAKSIGTWAKKIWADHIAPFFAKFVGIGEFFKGIPAIILHGLWDPFADAFSLIKGLFTGDIGFVDFLKGMAGAWFDWVMKLPIVLLNIIGSLFGAGDLGNKIFDGIKSIGGKIFDLILYPFKLAYDGIVGFFGGESASKLGLSIVDGIKSIGTMLLNFLTTPFKSAWKLIKGVFSGDIGIVDAIKSIGSTVLDWITWPFRTAMNFIGSLFGIESLGDSIIQPIKDGFGASVDWVMEKFTALKEWFGGFGEKIKNVFSGVGDFIEDIWGSVLDILKAPFNFIIKGINWMIRGINSISIDIPDVLGGGTIGFNLPEIPELQTRKGEGWEITGGGLGVLHKEEAVGTFNFDPIIAEIRAQKAQLAKPPEFDTSEMVTALNTLNEKIDAGNEIAKKQITKQDELFGFGGTATKAIGREQTNRLTQYGS